MKHSIVLKFIAVALCAAFLLGAVGSGIGALCLTEMGLYEQTVDEVYEESRNLLAETFANQLAQNYASQTLGGCPEEMTDNYVHFNAGYYSYTLKDAQGNVLKERELEFPSDQAWSYSFQVQTSYQKLIESIPDSELYPTTEPVQAPEVNVYDDEYVVYDALPADGAEVQAMSVTYYTGGTEGLGSDDVLGWLTYQEDGSILFVGQDGHFFLTDTGPVSYVSFIGMNGELLYEASAEAGGIVGEVLDSANSVQFQSWLTHFDTTSKTVVGITEPPMATAAPATITENPTEAPTEAPTEVPTQPEILETKITDNIAKLGSKVACITIFNADGFNDSMQEDDAFGYLFRNADGTITFRSYGSLALMSVPENINHIAFLDAEGWLLYEVQSPDGVGEFSRDNDGHLRFVTTVIPMDATPAAEEPTQPAISEPITIPDTTTATAEVDTPVTIPETTPIVAELTAPTEAFESTEAAKYSSDEVTSTYYYDSDLGQHVQAAFVYEDMPEAYTVELILAPGAYEMDAVYDLLQFVWRYRNELLYVLGISLFGFAVTAVYLCCAAGKKKGREEVRAGGFNCLSLDVYLGAGALAVCALAVIGFEGGYYLLRYSPQLLAPFVIIMGYSAALIIVGFCFACSAQFKTPGGYWWKNTLIARCGKFCIRLLRWSVKLFFRFMKWMESFLGKFFPLLGRCIKFCWNTGIRLILALFRYTEKGLTWLGHFLGRVFRRVFAWTNRFLSLLPVTWQWLIIGGLLLFILFLSILTRSEGFIVLGAFAGLALVVYGSHCFGILLESTKRMGKGDLESKVDDKLMVGSFKEFAGDLNNLAGVAVIAAQKQMKSERMKAELITNVSHDIKTPLTSIINYVDLLQKPHTDEEQEVYLEVLSRQSQQMKKLLEDLIEMSKASTGNMTVNITTLNAGETVSQALGEFADKLEKAQLSVVVRQSEEPLYMHADGRLAWRVLSNILSNAVKYALPGTRVYIDVMELDGKVLISLKNISREPLNVSADELMERFVRGDASRNTEGSGLGLNIAQSLMEIQKGSLQLLVDGDLFKVTLVFPSASE